MMILRNGILSNLRARGRTALFGLLILALTVLLALGLGMWAYCARMLAQCEATYTSVAVVEYMGADYPSADTADDFARDAQAALAPDEVAAINGIALWQPTDRTLALVDGYQRTTGDRPYKNSAVVYCTNLYPYYENVTTYALDVQTGEYIATTERQLTSYNATLIRSLYTLDGQENLFIRILPGEVDFVPEEGKQYLLHGEFTAGSSSFKTIMLTAFPGGESEIPYLAVDGADDPRLNDSLFAQYAGLYAAMNNCVEVTASDDLLSLTPFHQGELTLTEGRVPAAGETGVCLVSGRMAKLMALQLGDPIELQLLPADPADRYAGYTPGQPLEQRSLTVVGITSDSNDHPGNVWVSAAEGGFSAPFFGYTLGIAVLENKTARQAVEALQALVPPQVRVTLYDQGYSAAANPLQTMRTTALAITLASAAGAAAALVLFAHLYIGRQQETYSLLSALGTPRKKAALWLLSGAFVIAGSAAALGGLVGGLLLGQVLRLALNAAQTLYSSDLSYSEAAIGLRVTLDQGAAVPLWPAFAAGLSVCAAALLLCLAFLRQVQRQQAPKRGRITARVPNGGTSTAGRGPWRFALLAIRRSGLRAGLVPAAALVLALFLGILAGTAQGWQDQLDSLYQNSRIEGQAVSSDGRSYSQLAVPAATARQLWSSGEVETLALSQSYPYAVQGTVPAFSDSSFGWESKVSWFMQQPGVHLLNDLSAAPEFYYSDSPSITWLDGWDESFLSSGDYPFFLEGFTLGDRKTIWQHAIELHYPALASDRFLQQHGLRLGDTVTVEIYDQLLEGILSAELQIVGSFAAQSSQDNLYLPLKACFDPEWLFGETDVLTEATAVGRPRQLSDYYDNLKTVTFETLRFTLTDAARLEAFRGQLTERQYSSVGNVGQNRTTILLRDGAFTQAVSGLGRYITFSGLLTPVLLLVVSGLGFVISWLMINGRRMEFAIMRGLGAPRSRAFWSFFWEQAVLCLLGCLAAGALLTAFGAAARWLAVGVFALCYLAGTAVSVLLVGRTNLMELLSERE